jgi:uncharacterized protein YodC (DUF2158 family)
MPQPHASAPGIEVGHLVGPFVYFFETIASAKISTRWGNQMSTDFVIAGGRLDALAPGDVVALRSGGPRMTVVQVNKDQVECTWFVNGQPVKQSFPPSALRYMDVIGTICRWLVSD